MGFTASTRAEETPSVREEREVGGEERAGGQKKEREKLSLGFERAKANLLFWPFMPRAYRDI